MPTKEQIQKMLTQVIDPELGKNILEAGMVRDIEIEGGQVNITLGAHDERLPVEGSATRANQSRSRGRTGGRRALPDN